MERGEGCNQAEGAHLFGFIPHSYDVQAEDDGRPGESTGG